MKDLIEEKSTNEKNKVSLKLRDEFISIAAHELNTPLTALTLQLHLINKLLPEIGSLENAKGKTIQNLAQSSAIQVERLSSLIENLLDTTRASTGKLYIERKKEDLTEIVKKAIKLNEIELENAKCTLTIHLETSVYGEFDSSRIQQVITNLLKNAIKYGAGKPIEIDLHVKNSVAKLVVCDHGIGLDLDSKVRIFKRFERASSMKTYAGLGLGLYLSKEIVTAHGGTIKVESKPGSGSCFIIKLPLYIN